MAGLSLQQELRICLRLALPLALAQLAQMATGFVDTVMMGQLGSTAIAAGGLGAISFQFSILMTTGVVSAVSPLVAEAVGAQQPGRIRRVFWQGLWLAVALGLLTMGGLGLARYWLPWLGVDAATLPLTLTYLQTITGACLPALLFMALRSFVAAMGHPRPVMVCVLAGTALNVVGNYGLALGRWGLPALGLRGIALASVISTWAMVGLIGIYIWRQPAYRSLRLGQGWGRFEGRELADLLRVGLPIGGLAVAEGGLFTASSFLMAGLGTVALAAHQIALQTAALTFMVPVGVSMAATVRVGHLIGQGKPQAARQAGLVAMGIGGSFMMAMAGLFWLAPNTIVGLYLDVADPANWAVVALAQRLLGIAALFQLADGIQVTAAGALRGLKDTRTPLLIGLMAYWGVGLLSGVGLAYGAGWGGVGLWCGLALGLLIAAIVLPWRFLRLLAVPGHSPAPQTPTSPDSRR